MASGGLPWTSQDSLHCWNALWALWSEDVFTNCLRPRSTTRNSKVVEEVESVVMRWDATQGKFRSNTEEHLPPSQWGVRSVCAAARTGCELGQPLTSAVPMDDGKELTGSDCWAHQSQGTYWGKGPLEANWRRQRELGGYWWTCREGVRLTQSSRSCWTLTLNPGPSSQSSAAVS